MKNVNFVHEGLTGTDLDAMFGPFEEDELFIRFNDTNTQLASLMVKAGLFKSIGEARRNGWGGCVPEGLNCVRFGKRKLPIWMYKPKGSLNREDVYS